MLDLRLAPPPLIFLHALLRSNQLHFIFKKNWENPKNRGMSLLERFVKHRPRKTNSAVALWKIYTEFQKTLLNLTLHLRMTSLVYVGVPKIAKSRKRRPREIGGKNVFSLCYDL